VNSSFVGIQPTLNWQKNRLSLLKRLSKIVIHGRKPVVVCLSGGWGTGKTKIWEDISAGTSQSFLCSVSLIGKKSIEEVHKEIEIKWHQQRNKVRPRRPLFWVSPQSSLWSQACEKIGLLLSWLSELFRNVKVTTKTVEIPVDLVLANLGRWVRPVIPPHSGGIICLDDVERNQLGPSGILDVMAYAYRLKKEHKHRVLVLFNREKDSSDKSWEENDEKLIDIRLSLSLRGEDAASVAWQSANLLKDSSVFAQAFQASAQVLGLLNIRTLQRCSAFLEDLAESHPLLTELDSTSVNQLVQAVLVAHKFYNDPYCRKSLSIIATPTKEELGINVSIGIRSFTDLTDKEKKAHEFLIKDLSLLNPIHGLDLEFFPEIASVLVSGGDESARSNLDLAISRYILNKSIT